MRIQELTGKSVAVLGYGREGQAMHRALLAHSALVTVCDADNPAKLEGPATVSSGAHYLNGLKNCDVIVKSSGIPDLPELLLYQARVTDQTQIFFDSIAGSGVRTIGITGSKGKSTTTTLIYEALRAHIKNVHLMGNIGIPVIDFLDDAKPGATFVIELSSYQLERLTASPQIAVLTSFFPEHLDRHGSVEAYWQAKRSIVAHQKKSDVIFFNAAYPECQALASVSPGQQVPFTGDDFPLPLNATKFRGVHNRGNLAAAYVVATHLGVPHEVALRAICNTPPLPHRLQTVSQKGGITWVNDSIATNPQATLAALEALDGSVGTLMLGGLDRGLDYKPLAKFLAEAPIKNIVLFPVTGPKIRDLIEARTHHHGPKKYHETTTMDDAVAWAAKHTPVGTACLLSCAAPSFNLYKDFIERGEAFVAAIKKV